ncbi:hypothetical protein M422DRAFT_28921, partial [Sphaerobolus stellatus SS14]
MGSEQSCTVTLHDLEKAVSPLEVLKTAVVVPTARARRRITSESSDSVQSSIHVHLNRSLATTPQDLAQEEEDTGLQVKHFCEIEVIPDSNDGFGIFGTPTEPPGSDIRSSGSLVSSAWSSTFADLQSNSPRARPDSAVLPPTRQPSLKSPINRAETPTIRKQTGAPRYSLAASLLSSPDPAPKASNMPVGMPIANDNGDNDNVAH